ncbi:MAG: DEAD/DEAH box helicase [bacterium]|nr:DEAD/DEAH box helicase [bacterium]
MIPTVLAGQMKQGVEDFLDTTFPVSTPFFHSIIQDFLEKEGNLFKGPFLSILLPFITSEGKRDFFPDIPLTYDPYLHQTKAFERLSGPTPQSTIIGSGTGSGKTECFMLPVLAHCLKHTGQPGIKAIFIYPMNALATDQAGRLAKEIHKNPLMRGNIKAGLFVGQKEDQPQTVMSENHIISDKSIMHTNPPDILLTNYKMLDYLLIRPKNKRLWVNNSTTTLKFLVVDELHTFDGAQGTDLACLIRRLKSRLSTPKNHLCCVGTSATIGSKKEEALLQSYARDVFAEPFDSGTFIHEERKSIGEFLENSFISYVHHLTPDQHHRLDPVNYRDSSSFIKAQYKLWFKKDYDSLSSEEPGTAPEVILGRHLKEHQLFQNLLRILKNRALSLPELVEELHRVTKLSGSSSDRFYIDMVNSLCALISTARDEMDPQLPFLQLRVQLWLRELRRMVAEVKKNPQLRFSDDLKSKSPIKHLPVIHCRDCGSTGWGGVVKNKECQVQPDLHGFYVGFFSRSPQLRFFFPRDEDQSYPYSEGTEAYLCQHCLTFCLNKKEECGNCGSTGLLPVFIPTSVRKGDEKNRSSMDCPFCLSRRGLNILGSQAAGLTSVLVDQLAASPHNTDKKIVAFSDSVQDAAHRGGFFAARTYSTTFRTALARVIIDKGEGLPLNRLPALFIQHWRNQMDTGAYITNFIGPNMEWMEEFDQLRKNGHLPAGSGLSNLVDKRVEWNIYSEFGFRARIGRTLERNNTAVLYPDPAKLEAAVREILPFVQEEIGGMKLLDAQHLKQFILGMLMVLKLQGGIFHPFLDKYIENNGFRFLLNRLPFTPNFGSNLGAPRFLSKQPVGEFETLLSSGSQLRSRHENWLYRNFADVPMLNTHSASFFDYLLTGLVKHRVLEKRELKRAAVWGLCGDALLVTSHVTQLRCDYCGHNVSSAEADAHLWAEMHCLRLTCPGHYLKDESAKPYYENLYRSADVHRLIVKEHTGLLERDQRKEVEKTFRMNENPWDPNVLSATPTIEMGIDIGRLSSVLLCSVPPSPANYLQRIGRGGRKNGNAVSAAVANAKPHDLYFFAEPEEMIAGKISPPGVFLEASAILERQFTAFCFDRWVMSDIREKDFPKNVGHVLGCVDSKKQTAFPYTFLEFIRLNRNGLFEDFINLFDGVLTTESISRLQSFTKGKNREEGSLENRILSNLQLLAKERKSYKDKIKSLGKLIKEKNANPVRDLNFQEELDLLENERDALQELVRSIDDKDALNFFTDEGLIPNYTFPEAGVLLRSVIYRYPSRRKEPAKKGKAGVAEASPGVAAGVVVKPKRWIYEYDRPARSAISELAPANYFYAGGRKVTIDRVDLNLSTIENWRFCPECNYSRCMDLPGELEARCPRCDSEMWQDAGQTHSMLRMRQVHANTNDKDSRIGDDKDRRDPQFYNKQMLVDVDPRHVESAYKISEDRYPFGFEFLRKVGFREINFGKQGDDGPQQRIAGVETVRSGFSVCENCGKVNDGNGGASGKKDFQREASPPHAPGCSAAQKGKDASFTRCLYLYREFTSEAIRIMLPLEDAKDAGQKVFSFIAALNLGLRKKFGGAVDHLQATMQEVPVPGSSPPLRRRYLLLYDQVPGGTGYLKQLMLSQKPMLEVLGLSLDVLRNCTCAGDPGKDGCYRCLLAFRTSNRINAISRSIAVGMLAQILEHKNDIVPTRHLQEHKGGALFESELEARFIDALFLHSKKENTPESISMENEFSGGKAGYYLTVTDTLNKTEKRYRLEKQVELGEHGVPVPSRADFVIWPVRESGDDAEAKPIAIFTDGYRYHESRLAKDTAQRMAAVQNSGFLVWSLTWQDVEEAFNDRGSYFDVYPDEKLVQKAAKKFLPILKMISAGALKECEKSGSFFLLLRYLARPQESLWRNFAFAHAFLWLDAQRFTNAPDHAQECRRFDRRLEEVLDKQMSELVPQIPGPRVRGWWPVIPKSNEPAVECFSVITHDSLPENRMKQCLPVIYLNDSPELRKMESFQKAWNSFLRYYNILQFLPLALITTRSGLAQSSFAKVDYKHALTTLADTPVLKEKWLEIQSSIDDAVKPLIDKLAEAGFPYPVPGYELPDSGGCITGEAELAWDVSGNKNKRNIKTALLMDYQAEFEPLFTDCGWQTVMFTSTEQTLEALNELLKKS